MVELSLHTHSPYPLLPISNTGSIITHTHTPYLHGDVIPTTNVFAAGWVPLPWLQNHDEPTTIAGAAGKKITTSHPRHNAKHPPRSAQGGTGTLPPPPLSPTTMTNTSDRAAGSDLLPSPPHDPITTTAACLQPPLQVLPGSAPQRRRHRQRSRSLSVRV